MNWEDFRQYILAVFAFIVLWNIHFCAPRTQMYKKKKNSANIMSNSHGVFFFKEKSGRWTVVRTDVGFEYTYSSVTMGLDSSCDYFAFRLETEATNL